MKVPALVRLAGILMLQLPVLARILRVPLEYSTIQSAIDASEEGDTVLVAPGTYTGNGNRDISFKGKAITVCSEAGPETCIIDCEGSDTENHRGFYFVNREDRRSVLEGFTIRNGYVSYAVGPGSDTRCGGAIFSNYWANPTIRNCIFEGNYAYNGGAGIACSDALILNCVLRNNRTEYGGPWLGFGSITCGRAVVANCVVVSNYGGGISCGSAKISNCLVAGNQGGGIVIKGQAEALISNCTVVCNLSSSHGAGLYFFDGAARNSSIVTNCIIWGNRAKLGGNQISSGYDPRGGPRPITTVELRYCFIESGPDVGYWWGEAWHKILGEGVILDADPCFARPGYWDPNGTPDDPYDDIWVDGDYHLKSQAGRWDPVSQAWVKDDVTSPCIDAGDPNSPLGLEPFPNGGRINMGAYGGTQEASKSYFGGPTCETIVSGDIDGNCKVDLHDLAILASHWLEGW